MSHESCNGGEPRSNNPEKAPAEGNAPGSKSPADAAADDSVANVGAPLQKLTADEQMALYEDDLKNSDWGHQPC